MKTTDQRYDPLGDSLWEKTQARLEEQQAAWAANLREQLADENPEALLYDGLDDALVGIARRCGQPALAVYSYQRLVEHFVTDAAIDEAEKAEKTGVDYYIGLTYEEAVEHVDFNIAGGWLGDHTPLILQEGADV